MRMEQKYIPLVSTQRFQTYYLVSLPYPTETDVGAWFRHCATSRKCTGSIEFFIDIIFPGAPNL